MSTDCPLEVEDLNKLAQMHDPNKEDAVDYSLFITCKKFISKVNALGKVHKKPLNIFIGYLGVLGLDSRSKLLILHSYKNIMAATV